MRLRYAVPVLTLSCLVALGACSSGEGAKDTAPARGQGPAAPLRAAGPGEEATPPVASATPVDAEGTTTGGDGSAISLETLTPGQLESVDLPGELACSFADPDGATLLLARADVLPDAMVRGAVNNHGYVEMLGNGRAGGFNDLADGITLSGKGLTVVLERGEPRPTGNETSRHAATLKVLRADGAERTWTGSLTCGP
jgi:hypothetical protein